MRNKKQRRQMMEEEVTRLRRPRRHQVTEDIRNHNLIQSIIVGLIVLSGEIHTFWEHSVKAGKWIYIYPWSEPMRLQNYVDDNASMLNWVLIAVFAWRHGKCPTWMGFWLLRLIIIWKLVNIPLYWYNYRTFGYGWVYFGLVVIGILTWKYGKK